MARSAQTILLEAWHIQRLNGAALHAPQPTIGLLHRFDYSESGESVFHLYITARITTLRRLVVLNNDHVRENESVPITKLYKRLPDNYAGVARSAERRSGTCWTGISIAYLVTKFEVADDLTGDITWLRRCGPLRTGVGKT
jgi:hypothetical protein